MWRERRSWALAAARINAEGYAAAVPPELVGELAALGYSVWGARVVYEPEGRAS